MTAELQAGIYCDAPVTRNGVTFTIRCGYPFEQNNTTVHTLRDIAGRKGWAYRDGADYCPQHAKHGKKVTG